MFKLNTTASRLVIIYRWMTKKRLFCDTVIQWLSLPSSAKRAFIKNSTEIRNTFQAIKRQSSDIIRDPPLVRFERLSMWHFWGDIGNDFLNWVIVSTIHFSSSNDFDFLDLVFLSVQQYWYAHILFIADIFRCDSILVHNKW